MTYRVIELLRFVYLVFLHYSQIFRLFNGINTPTYCPDRNKVKSKFSVIIDYLYLFFVLRQLPTNYYLFQFDTKKRDSFKEYMDEPSAPMLINKLYSSIWDDKYSSLVNDKYVFHCMCQYHALPVPEIYGLYRDGIFYGEEGNLESLMFNRNLEEIILKPVRGIQGKGIRIIHRDVLLKNENSRDTGACSSVLKELKEGHYIVQKVIKQHPELNRLNPYSINTVRIITFLDKNGKVELIAAMLRMSSNQSPIDNFKTGGIVTGINMATGRLKRYGFLNPEYGGRISKHPITQVSFLDYQIPYWEEVKTVAIRAQETYYQLKSIGWDCAITPEGPVIIEGNIEYGTAGIQAANEGLLSKKNRTLFSQYGLYI